jgi:glycosyltransferase involved in cell wall biosynthesis
MNKKIRIASIIDSLDNKFGGPPKGVIDQNIYFKEVRKYKAIIVNLDEKQNFPGIIKNKISVVNFKRSFLGRIKLIGIGRYNINIRFFFWLIKNRNNFDYFIFHQIWDFKNILARLFLKNKYYIFIHGSLDPYEKKTILKYIKKKIYWYLFEKKNLLQARSILLTSVQEEKNLKKTFVNTDGIKTEVTNYGITKAHIDNRKINNTFKKKFPFLKSKNYYLFIGRIDPKKGLDVLIKSIELLGVGYKGLFIIAGEDSNSYAQELKKMILLKNFGSKILFIGKLEEDEKYAAIINSKATILSTHAENFAISLVESLSCSVPVLTTVGANIYKTILAYKAGYVANINPISFSKIIKKFDNLSSIQKKQMNKNAQNCFKKEFNLLDGKKFLIDSMEK